MMKWKRFKRERISLNYTVMLLPHSQKKPIHFKTPVWTFGLIFLGILALSGTCLFFAGSRHQLKEVQSEKEQLEREWILLAVEKEMADEENESLRQAREQQEQELKQLEERTRDTIRELEELVERENQIRQELGLDPSASEDSSEDEEGSETDSVRTADTEIPLGAESSISHTERTMSFLAIQKELSNLQNSLSQMSGQYDGYLNTIEEKKEAEAAEIARREAVR